jgi:thiamine-monophosphate kinase
MPLPLGEFELIQAIREEFQPLPGSQRHIGIGDDAAVIEGNLLITTDALSDGVHFLSEKIDFIDLGYKAMAVNASDIAAMGGYPTNVLLTLGLNQNITPEKISRLLEGFQQARKAFPFELIGGDTIHCETFFLSITMTGKPFGQPILRNGAKKGDFIYATGAIGDSGIGLNQMLGKMKHPLLDPEYFVQRHYRPVPRIDVIRTIVQNYEVHSCIDISDGLLADLGHIAEESGCGYFIEAGEIPISRKRIGPDFDKDPLYFTEFALGGGEDYELIIVSPETIDCETVRLETGTPLTPIGRITEDGFQVRFREKDLDLGKIRKGFRHF